MKKYQIFFLAISVTIVSIFSYTGLSYAQSSSSENLFLPTQGVFIFVQTFLYNSDGQLVTYLASDKFTDLDLDALDTLLDSEVSDTDPIKIIDGKKFQIIKRQLTITYDKENVIASTIMAHSQNEVLIKVARFAHDGYPIIEGEKVHSIWTFIRPID